ncbi:MAG: hypothetical protein ACO3JL_20260, partial [Myxococcota bacterium]
PPPLLRPNGYSLAISATRGPCSHGELPVREVPVAKRDFVAVGSLLRVPAGLGRSPPGRLRPDLAWSWR